MWNWRKRSNRNRKNQTAAVTAAVRAGTSRVAGWKCCRIVAGGASRQITGDSADNAIEIVVENNNVVLKGLNDTTINGGTAAFNVATGTDTTPGSVRAYLYGGNDSVLFARGVKLGGAVLVEGGAGNDTISSTNATFLRPVTLHGGAGNNTFSLQSSTIQSSFVVTAGAGEDLVSLKDMTNNGAVTILTSSGDDGVSLNNVSGTGSYNIDTGYNDDDVNIQESSIATVMSSELAVAMTW